MAQTPSAAALAGSSDDAEARFYEALRLGDIERLMAVWADDDEIVCVHPGGPRVMGAAAIRSSFDSIFSHGGGVLVQTEQVRRILHLGSALHHLVERIQVNTAQGPQTAWVLATNWYVQTPLGWRLAAHHASPALAQEPASPGLDIPSTLH